MYDQESVEYWKARKLQNILLPEERGRMTRR
jgi:hypothetical protein